MFRPHHRPIKSASLGMGTAHQYFFKALEGIPLWASEQWAPMPHTFMSKGEKWDTPPSEMTEFSSRDWWWRQGKSPSFPTLHPILSTAPLSFSLSFIHSAASKGPASCLNFRSSLQYLYTPHNKAVSSLFQHDVCILLSFWQTLLS